MTIQAQSICTHSNPNNYIVFSTFNKSRTYKDNMKTFNMAKNYLKQIGVSFKTYEGKYKNEPEKSFIVNAKHEDTVKHICSITSQECYLLLKPHKHGLFKAFFIYPNEESFVGYLRSVTKERALKEIGYTYRKDMDTYWIITETDETINFN